MAIELRHLRYVLAATDNGSFRAAARALDVRESAISRRIRDLEDEIGAALFIRSHEGVKLTYAGQRFVCRARIALDQIGHATKDVGATGRAEDGVVRLGPAITPDSLRRFALAARRKLRNEDGTYRRDHLRALAQRVEVVDPTEIRIMGSKTELLRTLAAAASVETAVSGVRSFIPKWRARRDSNP